ncbi:MAG: AIM24 family protein [Proteobacteria bacterium]|nr:AIM24 family protein [Pseudomonadota bacterium]
MNDLWYVGINGQQQGPFSTQQMTDQIRAGGIAQTAYVYGQHLPAWTPISQIPTFAQVFAQTASVPPPMAPPANLAPVIADEIDFTIGGQEMQFVEIVLDPGEAAIADDGALFFMEAGIRIEPGAGLTAYANAANTRQRVAFAPSRPAKIVPIDLRQYGSALLVRTPCLLAAAKGISVVPERDYRRVVGQGLAFLQAGGTLVARELAPGETLRCDARAVVALEPRLSHDDQPITTIGGPGKLWLQSLRST